MYNTILKGTPEIILHIIHFYYMLQCHYMHLIEVITVKYFRQPYLEREFCDVSNIKSRVFCFVFNYIPPV
jgi:ABC-type arginine transport system permease subunit